MSNGKQINLSIRVTIEPDDGGFYAYCPDLDDVYTCGDTPEEALNNIKDMIEAYLESLVKHDEPIPVGIIKQRGFSAPIPFIHNPRRKTTDLRVPCPI